MSLNLSLSLPALLFRQALGGAGAPAAFTELTKSGNQAVAANTAILSFDTADRDPLGAYSAGAPTRLTVGPGISWVQLAGAINTSSLGSTTAVMGMSLLKNGAVVAGGFQHCLRLVTGVQSICVKSAPLQVVEGDYFELRIDSPDDAAFTIIPQNLTTLSRTRFTMRDLVDVEGALVELTTSPAQVNSQPLTYDAERYDTDGMFTAPGTSINIPAGWTRAEAMAYVDFVSTGSTNPTGPVINYSLAAASARIYGLFGSGPNITLTTGSMGVAEAQFYSFTSQTTDTSYNQGAGSWASVVNTTDRVGARARINGDQALNLSLSAAIVFNTEVYDDAGCFDAAGTGRMTIPADYSAAEVSWGLSTTGTGISGTLGSWCEHRNAAGTLKETFQSSTGAGNNVGLFTAGCTGPIVVEEGDYFTVHPISDDTSATVTNTVSTFFALELFGAAE